MNPFGTRRPVLSVPDRYAPEVHLADMVATVLAAHEDRNVRAAEVGEHSMSELGTHL